MLFKTLKPLNETLITTSFDVMREQETFEDKHIFRNRNLFFFNPQKRKEYDEMEYTERVEGVCVLVPIVDESDGSSYGILGGARHFITCLLLKM